MIILVDFVVPTTHFILQKVCRTTQDFGPCRMMSAGNRCENEKDIARHCTRWSANGSLFEMGRVSFLCFRCPAHYEVHIGGRDFPLYTSSTIRVPHSTHPVYATAVCTAPIAISPPTTRACRLVE